MVHALNAGGDTARLKQALAARDVPAVLQVMDALGTAEWVRQRVDQHTGAALGALDRGGIDNPYGEAIRDIAHYALGRES